MSDNTSAVSNEMMMSAKYVGARSASLTLEVNKRWSMNYAASVADANPRYFDDTREEKLLAPPMLAVALTWKVSADFTKWNVDAFPYAVLQQQVHYTEFLEWYRPLYVGEQITMQGECIAVLPHPAGTYLVVEYVAYDQTQSPVFREQIGGILRGIRCADKGYSLPQRVPLPKASVRTTHEILWEVELPISEVAPHLYDAGADIHFPIHTSKAFARAVGLPDILYHGTATLSLAVREILDREAAADPTRLQQVSCTFGAMVFPKTRIRIQALRRIAQENGTEIQFQVLNQENQRALRSGSVLLA